MARIHLSSVRKNLPVRREPHWGDPIERGLFLGFRKLEMGGNWIARWRNEEGSQLYKSLGQVTDAFDHEAAKKAAEEWKKAVAAGVNTDEVRTVADACREYVKNREKEKGESNAHDSEMRFKRTVYDAPIGKIALTKLSEKRVEGWRDALVASEAEGGHGLSKSSANRTMTALKAALNFATRKRYVTGDRVIEWKYVSRFEHASNRRELYLDLDQRRALLDAAKGAVRDLMEGVMHTGARPGELTRATRAQFRGSTITLDGKTGPREVLLNPAAAAFFKRMSKDKLPAAFLFTRDDGNPWGHSDWDELVRDAAKEAKLREGVCLYTLRHSFITDALDGGMTTLLVARNVGTSLLMIEKHYGQRADKAAAEQLARITFV